MKKITLLMVALLLGVTGVNAIRKTTTTLWKGTSYAGAEIHLENSKFTNAASGDVLRITFSFTTAGSMHLCYKTGEGGDWSAKAFNGISEWPNFTDTSVSSAEYSINATDLTTLQTYGMYIYGFTSSIITKIELIHCSPTGETELLDAAWTASWTAKTFPAQSSAKVGDVIRVRFTAYKDEGTDCYVQFRFMDGGGNELVDPVAASIQKDVVTDFEFEIVSADVLAKIKSGGFSIKGDQFVLNSVKLLTYADSYDAVSITVGSEGVATYSDGNENVQISACDALKAYYASAVAKGTVTLTELTGCIPANTGVMIYGAEGTYTVPVGTVGWPSITTNYLKPTGDYSANVTASTEGKYHYIFAKDSEDGKIGFFNLNTNYELAAHKAYLETSTNIKPGSSSRIALVFDDGETTGIQELENSSIEELNHSGNEALKAYYNLNGQRVTNPKRGLYIVNGKKVIIK